MRKHVEQRVIEPEQPLLPVREGRQMALRADDPMAEDPDYLSRQLLTYIGNKRALLGHIAGAVERAKRRLGKVRLRVLDAFSGSGVVSRFLKAHSSLLLSNDLEDYAAVTGRCYLRNKSTVDLPGISRVIADFNARVSTEPLAPGFIEELYAPQEEDRITREDRVFYTTANAR
jgi:adenine-specific DNA-methyltransferase